MLPLGPLVALALGSLREHWRVTLALLLGALLLSGSLAAAPITQDLLRGLVLREALDSAPPRELEVRVTRDRVALDRVAYRDAQAAIDQAVAEALGDAGAGQTRMGTTDALALSTAPPDDELLPEPLGRAVLRFRSGLQDHIALIEGRFPEALPRGLGDPIPVLVAARSAQLAGLAIGQQLILSGTFQSGTPPVPLVVAGIAAPLDPADPYWGGRPELLERAPDGALALLLPETTFFGAVPDLLSGASAEFESIYGVAPAAIEAGDVAALAQRVRELPRSLAALGGAEVESALPIALADAGELRGFDRAALLLLYGQFAAAAGLLVYGAAALLSRRREVLRASLRLRGATPGQLATVELIAVLPAVLLALLAGPPLAAAAVSLLGRLDAFEPFAGGGRLTVELGRDAVILGALGAAAALAIALAAAGGPRLARRLDLGRGAWLVAAAVATAAGALFWALTRTETLFEPSTGGAVTTEHVLLLAPLALLAPAVLLSRLLLAALAGLLARVLSAGRGIAVLGGLRAVAREPLGAAFPLVLLAAAAAVLLATLPGTLARSPEERAAHVAGGDLRAGDLQGLTGLGEIERRAAIECVPLDAASPLVRDTGVLSSEGVGIPVELLGIDPASFGAVASFRADLSADPLPAILSALGANAASLEGISIPANTRQIGAWVRLAELGGETRIALSLRNERGGYVQLLLGLEGPVTEGTAWRLYAADLETPLSADGTPVAVERLAGRLTLHGYYLRLDEAAAAAPGVALLGPLLTTTDPPAAPLDAPDRLSGATAAFERRAIVHDLANRDGLEPIAGIAPGGATDRVRDTISSPPGFGGAQRLEWEALAGDATADPPAICGLRQETDGAPVLLYASATLLEQLAIEPGSDLALTVRGRTARVQIAGELAGFPTFPANSAFVVAGLDRLLTAINASPSATPLATNEAWFASSSPALAAATVARLPLQAALVVDRDTERAALGEARVAALGWRAVLTLGFAALVAAAAAGVLLDLAARTERRDQEWAALDALGGSPAGRLGATAWETGIRLGLAAAIGAGAGAALARWLLDILGRDAEAGVIVPPLRAELEAGVLWLGALVLLAGLIVTVAAVALRYRGGEIAPLGAQARRGGET